MLKGIHHYLLIACGPSLSASAHRRHGCPTGHNRLRVGRHWRASLAHREDDIASLGRAVMDTTTLLIIVIVLLAIGGGWYGRGRWY